MRAPHRNQLVWLSHAAWLNVRGRNWDLQVHTLLEHWHTQRLPLVVCRQRTAGHADSISLGLPAPLQWDRRKVALEVRTRDLERVGHFPILTPDLLGAAHAAQLDEFVQGLNALHLSARVFGSYGWQQLTGLPCVRDQSDLDLLVEVPDLHTAALVANLLQGLDLGCRVDGELVLPQGQAVAWREYAQLRSGQVDQVLIKHRKGVELCGQAQLEALVC